MRRKKDVSPEIKFECSLPCAFYLCDPGDRIQTYESSCSQSCQSLRYCINKRAFWCYDIVYKHCPDTHELITQTVEV